MSNYCIFCKIVSDEAQGTIVYRDEQVTAFRDIHPVAPTHVLIVPNQHIDSVDALQPENEPMVGHMVRVAGEIARQAGISKGGYRLIMNTGPDASQSVLHLHLHLIGGQRLRFPMG